MAFMDHLDYDIPSLCEQRLNVDRTISLLVLES